ncbi:class I SAM-dependent methyltransferase [Stenomitos frigidus]|uniref:Methyltransferase type 11 n=1 Tax=Stenomitos frigidus ULC18 TaxID=2107698 RepID=A0A2T1DZU8_9CYAN|nr:methyltransferase domain-containing protein [Stenomitos frigidus]PSB25981.1 methyltransferase type 11 [Stenomitos frigidus ULC18]
MKYLNLGCGRRFHSDWTNIDFTSTAKDVIAHDLGQSIPFPENSFDVVYHSHLLEHFSKQAAKAFIKECCRVLRPDGILRVAVPDLEQIAHSYLAALELALSGSHEGAANYDWILLEMYDQTARNKAGGEMLYYLHQENIPNVEYVIKRCNSEIKTIIEMGQRQRDLDSYPKNFKGQFRSLLKPFYYFFRYPKYRRDLLLKMLLGQEFSALEIGRFRQSGEVHYWMYDRYSLSLLLRQCGLESIMQRTATESYIPNWSDWHLDTEPDGTTYKPDSLFVEAIKPTNFSLCAAL